MIFLKLNVSIIKSCIALRITSARIVKRSAMRHRTNITHVIWKQVLTFVVKDFSETNVKYVRKHIYFSRFVLNYETQYVRMNL